ncbi:MAG: hypothetical protein ACREQ7_09120 [Candidatus Binatia bacterium]
MIFYTQDNKPIEVNARNFSHIPPGHNLGLTPVKFKDGTEEWLTATIEEILRAVKLSQVD